MIKAITFDLDGVYFTAESFPRFVNCFSDPEKAMQVLKKSNEMADFKLGKMSEDDYWDYVRKELAVPYSNEEIFTMLRDSYEVNQQVRDFEMEVRTRGIKTCICTNNFVTRIRELDEKFDFLKDFDVKVISYQVGVAKPDKGIFEELIRQTDCAANEIIYADDNESSYKSALSVGINAFLYTNFEDFKTKCSTD
ncbi:MAG: HAD family phosphatase [Candidatus Amesbacteria bacterium]|nr:HAD family phosphatase [Candidatus Amesbacteria bacterium]